VRLTPTKIEISEKIYFKLGSDNIRKRSHPVLDQIASLMLNYKHVKKVLIEGHTDGKGPKKSNLRLSSRRAKAVVRYLVDKGIEEERLTSEGIGEERPVGSNKTRAGRELNRRVEFLVKEMGKVVETSALGEDGAAEPADVGAQDGGVKEAPASPMPPVDGAPVDGAPVDAAPVPAEDPNSPSG
jgi:OOP family OmpA-OmpF porin